MCIDIFYPLILFNFNQPTKHNVLLVPFFFVLYLPAFFSSTQTKYNTTHTNFHCLCTSEWTKDACTCAFIFCSMCLSMLTLGLPHKYWNWHVTASSLSLTHWLNWNWFEFTAECEKTFDPVVCTLQSKDRISKTMSIQSSSPLTQNVSHCLDLAAWL